ncbi:hypothetical protein [Companilactobacillus nodensis]|uniref:Uncharacterized protein n=1 Tax=Companilactobacillus nodensis DSM 19682 = JCM 14932 = NBRC 107160 TaxID=1423775 RepID=A0A0R1K9L7_9LACO|nr:hypothetical protein [Companilactobacillus nodensis]KRK80277.1 hypothetical protein FD03_GL002603 [Companilactobacillus nodensis DSM 19682 = JCM 14932 = NBRC 107160]
MNNTNQSRSSRHRQRKNKPFYQNIKFWIITFTSIIALVALFFGVQKYREYKSWQAPYYSQTGKHVLLSSDTDKLSDNQEEAFYNLVKGAIKSDDSKADFTNIEDKSLYVEKMKQKQTYYIEYVCTSNILVKLNYKTSVIIKLKSSDLKNSTKFTYWDFHSTLTDLLKE